MSYNLNQLSFKYPPRKKSIIKKGSKLRRLPKKKKIKTDLPEKELIQHISSQNQSNMMKCSVSEIIYSNSQMKEQKFTTISKEE